MKGLIFSLTKGPRDQSLNSGPITVSVAAAVTRIIHFPSEFRGMASGLQIINRDAANTVTITINNDAINAFTIPASSGMNMGDQWIEQIQVVAGAAGVTVIQAQITPNNQLGIGQ